MTYFTDVSGTKRTACLAGHRHRPACQAFSPDGRLLVSGGSNEVFFWSTRTGRELRRLSTDGGLVCDLCFSPNGRKLVLASEAGKAQVVDVEAGKVLHEFPCGPSPRVAVSRDGERLACGDSKGLIALYDLNNPKQKPTSWQGHASAIGRVVFTPEGKGLYSAGDDGQAFRCTFQAAVQLRRPRIRGSVKR
jgi:WD40 repeat protein